MSQHEVELCALLVDETYGELTSRMFTILLRRGRLTTRLLQEHTQLNRRQLRHGLALLIQQNLVYHFFDVDTEETMYEANQAAAYALIRSGKFMEVAEGKYGSTGLDAVHSLLLLGQAKVSDLVDTCVEREHKRKQKKHKHNGGANGGANDSGVVNGMNGDSENYGYTENLESTLFQLLQAGYVEPVTRRLFRSPTDTRNEIEKNILKEKYDGSTKGTKQKDELKHIVRNQMQALRAEDINLQPVGKKRLLNGHGNGSGKNGHSKRRKFSHDDHAINGNRGYEYTSVRLERDLLLRINYEKFTVTLRNDRLVELVRDRIGETTSKVYAEVLRLIEDQISRCQLDPEIDDIDDLTDGPSITTMQLSTEISDEINIATGIGKAPSHKINTSLFKKEITERKLKTEEDIEDEGGGSASSDEEESEQEDHEMNETETVTDATEDFEDHGEDHFKDETTANSHKRAKVTFEDDIAQPTSQEASDNRVLQLRNHLMLLATDSCRFLRRCGLDGRGQWTVDYDQLVDHLRETEVNLILFENFGLEGHRLVRMMRKMGKLDEKMLPNTALMSQKDLRTKLAEMQMAGMVEVQCVPRDAAHTVNRSIYLWFFDADRVASMLLHKVYKTMSRCLQRLEIERRRASGILSLAARSDVQEKIEVFFNGEQLNLLQNFRAKEEMLVGQLARLDDLVGIFRDY